MIRGVVQVSGGVDLGYLQCGSDGPLVICLHGFPDTARTWRHLLPSLAGAGYRAVALFMRGYAPSSLPGDNDYSVDRLADDVLAVHHQFAHDEPSSLIGHDWGAEAAFRAVARDPEPWRKIVAIASPPPELDAVLLRDREQHRRLRYAEILEGVDGPRIAAAGSMALIKALWTIWAPGYDCSSDIELLKESLPDFAHVEAAVSYYRDNPLQLNREGVIRRG